jgi:hypothetical protein
MSEDRNAGGSSVGYGKPPKAHQFKPGQSGNLGGRSQRKNRDPADVADILSEPIAVQKDGVRQKMPPFEVIVRQLVKQGLHKKNLNAIAQFLKLCESLGVMKPPPVDHGGSVVYAPKGVVFHEWIAANTYTKPPQSAD